jgi:hypothetical protein
MKSQTPCRTSRPVMAIMTHLLILTSTKSPYTQTQLRSSADFANGQASQLSSPSARPHGSFLSFNVLYSASDGKEEEDDTLES